MRIDNKVSFSIIFYIFIFMGCNAQKSESTFQDKTYNSKVFGTERYYRIYLPEGYGNNSKKYPVIYYFHGWGGRHFKDDNALLEYQKIKKLVDKYQVILVMWDGRIIDSESRPYNIGCPEHVRFPFQMKDYFVELVSHIDSAYNTLKNRESRAIIGYSMGGFMSFYLAGKYPDIVSTAVNMTGSPEFFIGQPDNNTLYPLRYTFANLKDVKTRLHNSSVGELSAQNREVHKGAIWQGGMDYEYWEFPGGHKVDEHGETKVFEAAMNFIDMAFQKPNNRNKIWSHYDLYPEFNVWGYSMLSNKSQSGFTYLRNVSENGFGFYSKKWLPIGPPLNNLSATITTAAIYEPRAEYQIRHYRKQDGQIKVIIKRATSEGRLIFKLDGTGHEIGIYRNNPKPKLTYIDYDLGNDKRLIRFGMNNNFRIKIVNLGSKLNRSDKVTLTLASTDGSIIIDKKSYGIEKIEGDIGIVYSEPIDLICNMQPTTDGAPSVIKFVLTITYGSEVVKEEFDVPVLFNTPTFDNLSIDDGLMIRDSIFGFGNGDGIASSGEKIMIYTSGNRTQLFSDDPYIEVDNENQYLENLPGKWNCDGITASSIIKIAENTPENHEVEFLAKYETKDYMPMRRRTYWGLIKLILNPTKK
ncbi:alpha/beta hydrolase [Wocania ichthyoenteri]|uniref:alpha/beta hydrolase n=1 Tax=Wocania ichthyoenteri TaxID=1230531 RepID=UPI0009DE52D9|nr:alpha/beta fold hydrolase [Wocania ichthyoenteri]